MHSMLIVLNEKCSIMISLNIVCILSETSEIEKCYILRNIRSKVIVEELKNIIVLNILV